MAQHILEKRLMDVTAPIPVGATSDMTIVCSCETGREATSELLVIHHVPGNSGPQPCGGSFPGWIGHPWSPDATGPGHR